MKNLLAVFISLIINRGPLSINTFYRRLANLSNDIDRRITKQAKKILAKNKELILDTTREGIYVGDYEPQLNGYPQLESIKIIKGHVFIKLELENEYYNIKEYCSLRLSDKLEIDRVLQEHRITKTKETISSFAKL